MKRGGHPEHEIAHGQLLVAGGAGDIWGWETPAGLHRVAARVAWLSRVCRLGPGRRVLECGCGTGIFTRRLAATGAEITAVDISDALLDEARRSCQAPNVRFCRCNLEHPSELPDGHFDALLGISVLHHLDLPVALPALLKKLKRGADVAFSEPNLLNPINRYVIFTDDMDKRRRLGVSPTEMAFRPDELARAFQDAGLTVHSLRHRDFLHPRTPRLAIGLFKAAAFLAERLPLVRRMSGSLWIHAKLPENAP
ncbi:MAG: class I SAM-dependent methyltransferase [Planctomycetaceae bacterium]|nr:class I SAM-dependent methyltransferase [Planctomycetaceae bacterium]